MKQIKASEIQENMIIEILYGEHLVVDEVWPDQGPGLGIMVHGKTVRNVEDKALRFYDPDEIVNQITPAEQGTPVKEVDEQELYEEHEKNDEA